jgi:hypothetical protein
MYIETVNFVHLGYIIQSIAPRLQICSACYCTEYCRQFNKILYYNHMVPPSYMWSVIDQNVIMRHRTVRELDSQTLHLCHTLSFLEIYVHGIHSIIT